MSSWCLPRVSTDQEVHSWFIDKGEYLLSIPYNEAAIVHIGAVVLSKWKDFAQQEHPSSSARLVVRWSNWEVWLIGKWFLIFRFYLIKSECWMFFSDWWESVSDFFVQLHVSSALARKRNLSISIIVAINYRPIRSSLDIQLVCKLNVIFALELSFYGGVPYQLGRFEPAFFTPRL